jgi:hypothetical protein
MNNTKRTPDEIYAEIRSLKCPTIGSEQEIEIVVAHADACAAHHGRVGALWDELYEALGPDTPEWARVAVLSARWESYARRASAESDKDWLLRHPPLRKSFGQ